MAKSLETIGLLYSDRNPKPKPSPKSFSWPAREQATQKTKESFAASLQELLLAKGMKHVDLAREIFGTNEAGALRQTGKPRGWVTAKGPFCTPDEAGFVAELLGVPMQRLLQPKGKFDPKPSMVREKAKTGEGRFSKKRFVDDPDDPRWVLPEGVAPPVIDMKTADRPDWVKFSITGEMPTEVAMGIMAMARSKNGPPQR